MILFCSLLLTILGVNTRKEEGLELGVGEHDGDRSLVPCAPELFIAELGKLGAGRMTADEKSGLVEKYTSLFWVTAHVLLT